jgi:hypothetical protein
MHSYIDISRDLQPDGALRDFYIFDITRNEWQVFIDFMRSHSHRFLVDGVEQPLPLSIAEILDIHSKASTLLSIHVGNGFLNCHFFSDTEIELDFIPADFQKESDWNVLRDFLISICRLLKKPGKITYENSPDWIITEIQPDDAEQGAAANP